MSEFLDRISKLSPQRLALLADELNDRLQASERRRTVPLAIVGMGCHLPGGVQSPEEFWKLLSEGVDAVSEVPASRWNTEELYDSNPEKPGKMATRWGGFIDGPDQFDSKFFGIAPAEAINMDPQQRLLLETSWEALEDAAIAPSSLAGSATGVFVGICNGDYSQIALNTPREAITPYFASGLSHAVAAGRISYVLGLQGPSLAIDTSCSASLVAVHLACQSLRLGESDTALAGGVNLILNPDITVALSQSKMMAPDGRCKAFSDSANGFVRAEGCGMIVLKRLPDAIRDRNRILAVIRGTACNQDGRSSGLTAPNGPSQEAVIAAALADAGLRPEDVDAIEAHGTGTSLGDPIEAEALNAVFAGRSKNSAPLFVGSVKTNLGHLESAAGIAGMIKLVLSIQHGQIPANLHLGKPNHRVEWDRLPMKIPTQLQAWNRRGGTRVGGVSSFGFSGTNAHAIVEEYLAPAPERLDEGRPLLFTLSAKTSSALQAIAGRLDRYLVDHPSLSLADIARTLSMGRSHFEFRAAGTAASFGELLQLLRSVQTNHAVPGIETGRAVAHSPRVAFVFGGEQMKPNAGRELFEQAPAFREAIQRCEEILRTDLDKPLTAAMYGKTELSSAYRTAANFAFQYALVELWRSCGIEPSAVSGCGVGEFVAACIAGVFSLKDGLRLAVAHSRENQFGFDELARSISYHEPRIPLISNLDNAEITAEYWLHRSAAATLDPSVLSVFSRESCAANIYIGDSSKLQQFANSVQNSLSGKWLVSLGNGPDDCRHFFHAAASLYVLGCDLNMSGFYRDAANTVSLPTYPFEKERYWLDLEGDRNASGRTENLRQPVQADAARRESDEWIYDVVWEPKPLLSEIQRSTAVLDENLLAHLAWTPANAELMRAAHVAAAAMPVYSTYVIQALQQGGLVPLPKSAFTLEELSDRLRVVPARRRVLARLLGILVEDKIVERTGDRFRFIDFEPRPDADRELKRLGIEYPECLTELNVLRRCGRKLLAVLQGEYDPMQLVFADGSIDEAEQIYERSAGCRFFNDKAAQVVRSAVDPILGRAARILEIGAGTGASTKPILSELAGRNIEYTFTDVSGVFLSRARTKFAQVPSMIYRLLDVENDPVGQGFDAGGYDVIVAANVLHATANLRRTVGNARKLLAPGGVLLLIEGVTPDRWLDLTMGLTDGWFRFVDTDLRPEHPLISAENWARVLGEAGMSSCRTISYVKDDGSLSQQRVIVAQVDADEILPGALSSKPSRDWVIFADESGVGDALHKSLSAAGERSEIVRRPSAAGDADLLFRQLQGRPQNSTLEVVYLWGLDASESIASIGALSRAEELCCQTLIHLIQSLLRGQFAAHLSIVTRGAQATESFSPSAGGAVQSLAWGIGRVFGVEAPQQYRALIDLDPAMPPEAAAANLLAELSARDREDQIAYRDGRRLAPRLQHSQLETSNLHPSAPASLREDGSYLLVGGLGGVSQRLAKWAAEQRAGHLILLGRTGVGKNAGPFAANRARTIEEIRNLGVKVTVVEGDVASLSEMQTLFRRFDGEFPPLRGIFHAATIISAAELGNLTDAQIKAMLRPKVAGTWVLHELTKNLDLDFFLVFSSAASTLGGKGMGHYSAANQFQDSFAHYRRSVGLPMLSVDWGTWDVMRLIRPEQQVRFSESGILPMESEKVLSLFGDLMASKRAQVMIANMDWDVSDTRLEVRRSWPLLEHLRGTRAEHRSDGSASVPVPAGLHAAVAMPSQERKDFIEAFVLQEAARVLGFQRRELPPVDVPLTDLGLDSLMAVDLKNRLQTGLGQELSPTIVFDYPTIAALVEMLETMLWAGHGNAEGDLASAHQDVIRI